MNKAALTDLRAEMKRIGLVFSGLYVSQNPGRTAWQRVGYVEWNSGRPNVYRIEYIRCHYNDGADADIKQAVADMLTSFSDWISGVSHSTNADRSVYRVTFTL